MRRAKDEEGSMALGGRACVRRSIHVAFAWVGGDGRCDPPPILHAPPVEDVVHLRIYVCTRSLLSRAANARSAGKASYLCLAVGCMMTTAMVPASATALAEELASAHACFDPSGASCTCIGPVSLSDLSLTGTLPVELSACTGITSLYAIPNTPTSRRKALTR